MYHTNMRLNNVLGLNENTTHHYPCHNCYFLKTDILYEIENKMKNDFDSTSKNKFRCQNDLELAFLHASYSLENGYGKKDNCLNQDYYAYGEKIKQNKKDAKNLAKRKAKCICINDGLDGKSQERVDIEIDRLQLALEEKLPYPTPFEKDVLFE